MWTGGVRDGLCVRDREIMAKQVTFIIWDVTGLQGSTLTSHYRTVVFLSFIYSLVIRGKKVLFFLV